MARVAEWKKVHIYWLRLNVDFIVSIDSFHNIFVSLFMHFVVFIDLSNDARRVAGCVAGSVASVCLEGTYQLVCLYC